MPPYETPPDLMRRVLIVDDAATCRQRVRLQLASEAMELLEASTGQGGFELARADRPDLILLDLVLPDIDGFEVIRRLKNAPATRTIPVLFLSGFATPRDRARGLDLGAIDFLSKPTDAVELCARVRAALRSKYLQDLLEERAHLDGLTGLGNRFALEERLDATWQLCCRRGTPLTILLADLDHFKRINDEHGHATGDEVLRRAAQVLRASIRGCDFAARYGGEEFVVLAPDCGVAGGVAMAERFRRGLSGPQGVARHLLPNPVTTCVGVCDSDTPGCTAPDVLIHRADRALYRAKSAGRNATWYWDPRLDRPVATSEMLRPDLCTSLFSPF